MFKSEGAVDKQRTISVPPGRFFFLRQQRMLGTGQAILLAEPQCMHFDVTQIWRI